MIKKMFVVILNCFWSLSGVFGSEFVSVMEGDSFTLSVSLTETQRKEGISWKFGPRDVTIAEIEVGDNNIRVYEDRADGRFKGRLKLDHSGSLTITNITTTDSGLYKVSQTSTDKQLSVFNLNVYAHLPVPVIKNASPENNSSSERSNCSLLCSVLNGRDVTLSWYKGNSLLFNISESNLKISNIFLRLEVDFQDSNAYRCVAQHPLSEQTQDYCLTDLCQQCSGLPVVYIVLICCAVGFLMIVAAVLIFCICRKLRTTANKCENNEEDDNKFTTYTRVPEVSASTNEGDNEVDASGYEVSCWRNPYNNII
ncbi:T-cell surface antigen CD2-like [Misgurnus anguillicaudatus]|uniref:T-cell surface antigen CD2-like n=1 Tax=Misgurnus anguillicaudatus TaxID=75329 RepID=UPI003CCFC7F7